RPGVHMRCPGHRLLLGWNFSPIIARAAALSQSFASPYPVRNDMSGNQGEAAMNSSGAAPKRRLGAKGPEVTSIGLGCMSLSAVYGPSDDKAAVAFLQRAVDLGVDHFDSSDMYGWGQNEEVVGRALKPVRDKVLIASKFGQTQRPGGANGV